MGQLEDDVKEFLDDVEVLLGQLVLKLGDPDLQKGFEEVRPSFKETKEAIDGLSVPLEQIDPVMPLKVAVYKKLKGGVKYESG